MNPEEAIAYIHGVSWRGKRKGLDRIRDLLSRMGNPERKLSVIHIAGTNGKGSTAEILSSILEAAGYKTGLFTSPYISRFHERIRIDHRPISDAALVEATKAVRHFAEQMPILPSEFELITAIAFRYFAENKVDFVVLEVGLGGRCDATNVIEEPLLSVITSIGIDHVDQLGGSIEEIAAEKAGIIKPGRPVVAYGEREVARKIIRETAAKQSAPLSFSNFSALAVLDLSLSGTVFCYQQEGPYTLHLLGEHQLKNAATALTAVHSLQESGIQVSDEAIALGIQHARWPGRFELLSAAPPFILDGAHNAQASEAILRAFSLYFPGRTATILVGTSQDRDPTAIVGPLDPIAKRYIAVQADNPRSMNATVLAETLRAFDKPVLVGPTIREGIARAHRVEKEDPLFLAIGSLYNIAEVHRYFEKQSAAAS